MRLKSLLAATALTAVALLPAVGWAKPLTVAIANNLTGLDPTNINDTLSQLRPSTTAATSRKE